MVKHLSRRITKDDANRRCCLCTWSGCCNNRWQKVNALVQISKSKCIRSPTLNFVRGNKTNISVHYFRSSEITLNFFLIFQVWAVLKPGFLAFLKDPFDSRLLDIIIFDVLPLSKGEEKYQAYLAEEIKKRNPLHYAFKVRCFNKFFNTKLK